MPKATSVKKMNRKAKKTLTVSRLANETFAINKLRPGQTELIEAVLTGHDAVGIMPTGSGKSLCFQLPSLLLGHTVVVVSPLISLMQDQEQKMLKLGVPVVKLDSTLTAGELRLAKEQLEEGVSELVYITPERLDDTEFLTVLKEAGVSLIVVDEAHCISQWGHDFRPAYTALAGAIKSLGAPPVMALTATATEDVLGEIISQLQLKNPIIVRQGIDRPNLLFTVCNTVNELSKQEKLLESISTAGGASIIYTATVKKACEVADWLTAQGVKAVAYHGKLAAKRRREIQDHFMNDRCQVIVATKAFGMGIDKPDVRLVLHYQFPDSVESYYQEAGRGGRDGLDVQVILLYQLEDKRIQSYFLGGKYPNRQEVTDFLQSLQEAVLAGGTVNLQTLSKSSNIPLKKLRVIANYLESAGVIKKERGIKVLRQFSSDEQLEQFLASYEERHQSDRDRLEKMMHYAQTMQCRVVYLRQYFGEDNVEPCGRCDNCIQVANF